MSTSTRQVLRRATRGRHDELDASFAAGGWLDDLDRYAEYLRRLAGCHAVAEGSLAGLPVVRRTGHEPKAHLVARDLEMLGADEVAICVADDVSRHGGSVDEAGALGVLYTIEGSTLGGRVLAREVGRRLGPRAGAATSLIDPYGDATHRRWRRTLAAIERCDHPVEDVIEGAVRTFELFAAHLVAIPEAVR